MKTSYLPTYLALLPGLAYASPIIVNGKIKSPATPLVEARQDGCIPWETIITTISDLGPTWKALGLAGMGTTALSDGVCRAVTAGTPQADMCSGITEAVAGGLVLIAGGVYSLRTWRSTGATSAARRGDASIAATLENYLQARGAEYESIYSDPIVARDENSLDSETINILGLRYNNESIAVDHRLMFREDGVGHVRISPTPESGLQKRHDGAGFKISYQTIREGDTDPAMGNVRLLADAIAQDWDYRAEHDSIDQYIGSISFGDNAAFGFRIIPETKGFGEEYEDVNICGQVHV